MDSDTLVLMAVGEFILVIVGLLIGYWIGRQDARG